MGKLVNPRLVLDDDGRVVEPEANSLAPYKPYGRPSLLTSALWGRIRKGPLAKRSPISAGFATPKDGAIAAHGKNLALSTINCQGLFAGVGKTPDSRMRPTVAVRQSSCGMSLLRSRTARLKSRQGPTPCQPSAPDGDTPTSIPRPEGRKWGSHTPNILKRTPA